MVGAGNRVDVLRRPGRSDSFSAARQAPYQEKLSNCSSRSRRCLQQQQDLRSAVDTNSATLKTLVQQSLDGVAAQRRNGLAAKTVQEVQANTGSSIDYVTQTTRACRQFAGRASRASESFRSRLTDIQNLLQSIDAKVSGSAPAARPAPAGGAKFAAPGQRRKSPPGGARPAASGVRPAVRFPPTLSIRMRCAISPAANTIFRGRNFPTTSRISRSNDLASNSQFYLGEISYAQNDFKDAITAYDNVLRNYPHSFKLAASLYKKGMAELELGMKASGVRDLREVVRRFPGSDEARRAASQTCAKSEPRPEQQAELLPRADNRFARLRSCVLISGAEQIRLPVSYQLLDRLSILNFSSSTFRASSGNS